MKFLDEEQTAIDDACRSFLAHSKANKSYKTYEQRMYILRGFCTFALKHSIKNLSDLNLDHLNLWKDHLLLRYKPNTVHVYIEGVSLLFSYAMDRGWINNNPVKRISKPKLKGTGRALNETDRIKFFEVLPRRFHAICWFALYTGLRLGEAMGLEWGEVTNDYAIIPAEKSKNGNERKVVLSDGAKRYMGKPEEGRVFRVSRQGLQRSITKTWKAIGRGRIRFHDFRHTLAENYPDGNQLGMMLNFGWSDSRTLMKYRHHENLSAQAGITKIIYK